MTEFRFASLLAFVLLLPLILLVLRALRGDSTNQLGILSYSDTTVLRGLPATWRVRLRRLPTLLSWLSYILLVIALSRPQFGSAIQTLATSGIDLVIALDISDSMASGDLGGISPLEAAKNVTSSFATDRPNDRLGLVVFAEQAFYLSPPTLDHTLYNRILTDVTYASALQISNRSAIGIGISTAANLLVESTAPSRAVLLITDGANNAGLIDPITAAEAANALGIKVYTLGMGASTSDNELDETTLRRVSAITGGRYFNAQSENEVASIYDTINTLETNTISRDININWQDQAFGVLLVALIFLCFAKLLERTLFQTIP
jgi:Ca-activated chloride channel family protein